MDHEQFEILVREKEAHLFNYQEDGFLLFTHDGLRVHRLTDLASESLQAAHDFLECPQPEDTQRDKRVSADPECDGVCADSCGKNNANEPIEQMFTVNLPLDTLFSPDTVSVLNDAISNAVSTNTTQVLLRFQFQESPDSWSRLLESFCNHWQEVKDKNRLIVSLSGTFRELSDEDFAFFAKNDIQLEYVYPFAEGVPHFSEESKTVISRIAGKGLRLPIVWYIDETTLGQVLPLIDEAMFLNFNSGFSVPLSRHSLFSAHSRDPDEESYLSFLADLYEQHFFYDDVLFPLNVACISALKMSKMDFWKMMTLDSESAIFSPVSMSALDLSVLTFFSRLFLWQRWVVYQSLHDRDHQKDESVQRLSATQ
jgi:hypothetical protein